MKQVRQCSQCSSVDMQKMGEGEYRCRYCGSVQYGSGVPIRPSKIPRPGAKLLAGIGAVIAIMAIGGLVAVVWIPSGPDPASTAHHGDSPAPAGTADFGEESIEKEVPPEGTFTGVSEVRDSIGNVYFIGMYSNTGTVPIRQPLVTVVLYDAGGARSPRAGGTPYGTCFPPAARRR